MDSIGYRHATGLVTNWERFPVEFVRVTVDYLDAAGVLMLEDHSYTGFDIINPGQHAPFEIVSKVVGTPAATTFSIDWRLTPDIENHYFQISWMSPPTVDAADIGHLTGFVVNHNVTRASYVKVAFRCDDAAGQLELIAWTYVDSNSTSDVEPGRGATFELLLDPLPSRPDRCSPVGVYSSTPPALATTLDPQAAHVVYGAKATFTGAGKPGQLLSMQKIGPGGQAIDIASTLTTVRPDGGFSVSVPLTFSGMVLMRQNEVQNGKTVPVYGDDDTSVPIIVWPDALVTIASSATTVKHGASVALSGLVRPVYPGKSVRIERLVGGRWSTLTTVRLDANSRFTKTIKFSSAGRLVLRASIDGQAESLAGVSRTISIVVK